jgi:hypothetical protein
MAKEPRFFVRKKFSFRDHQTLKFSTEFFNFTNTAPFAKPSVVDLGAPVGELAQSTLTRVSWACNAEAEAAGVLKFC